MGITETRILEIFDYLHTHPEVSWKEKNTTSYIAGLLSAEGVRAYTFDDCTGLVAEIGKEKPVIAIRADIDALWQEVDGRMQANHSCGHDAHMTMVIGTLLSLKDKVTTGTVRFIFQPAEEKGNGALKMIEKGVADDIDYLFGLHLRPLDELPFGKAAPSVRHGAVSFLKGKFTGHDTHGARPHQGTNAIDVLTALNEQLKVIYLSPFVPYSVKMTYAQAGGDNLNLIPGNAEFGLDLRAQTNQHLKELKQAVAEKIERVGELFQTSVTYEWVETTPGAEVSEEAEELLKNAIIQALGKEALADPVITSGSDDFHNYTVKRPAIKASMLGIGAGLKPGLHHPNMAFDKRALMLGIQVLTAAVQQALKQ